MGYKVDNAVIIAAGVAARFAPISFKRPKGLIEVKGEILIERQIRQLIEAGISKIFVVIGYKSEMFSFLPDKYPQVKLVYNPDYNVRNNNASIYAVKDILKNTYICASDDYFTQNPFRSEEEETYYSAVYVNGPTEEWCAFRNQDTGDIESITIGGRDAWAILGHAFWDEQFSRKYREFLEKEYDRPETREMYWEEIIMEHFDCMKMKIREFPENVIYEFDGLDELRAFDKTYIDNTRSEIIKEIAVRLSCNEGDIKGFSPEMSGKEVSGFSFDFKRSRYKFLYATSQIIEI